MFQALDPKNPRADLYKLKQRRQQYLDDNNGTSDKPINPVGHIDKRFLGLSNKAYTNLRHLFLIPWLIGICITLYWQVDDFYKGWKAHEARIIRFVESEKRINGANYFETKADPDAIRMFQELNNKGEVSIKTYWNYHYYRVPHAVKNRRVDIALVVAYALAIPGLGFAIARYHRRAPLYFDRDKGIVYSWHFGAVMAQYYDELWAYANHHTLSFVLYSFDKKQQPKKLFFHVTPSGNPLFNDPKRYKPVLATIAQFMEFGRDAVFNRDWSGRRGIFLYEDKKPVDFDEQLAKVLTFLKEEKINEQADQLAREWGIWEDGPQRS